MTGPDKKAAAADKAERLAASLRANLQRRKAQARLRRDPQMDEQQPEEKRTDDA